MRSNMSLVEGEVDTLTKCLDEMAPKLEGRTVLVTGGAGFLGSWTCDLISALGAKVVCVDNLISGSEKNVEHLLGRRNFRLLRTDVQNLSVDFVVDYIVHMAGIASPPVYQKYPIVTLDTNVLGIRNILEIAKRTKVESILFTSTSEIYGDATVVPTPEKYWGNVNPIGPRSVYDEGKRVAETYCRSYFEKFKVPIRVARIFNTYGPRLDVKSTSHYGRVVVKFIVQALSGKPLTVYGNGMQTRSFCYITDLIEGLFKLLLIPGIDGETVNLGSNEEISILSLAKIISELTGADSGTVFKPLPEDDPMRRNPEISKAEKLLGWKPKVSLKEGLEKTIDWISSLD